MLALNYSLQVLLWGIRAKVHACMGWGKNDREFLTGILYLSHAYVVVTKHFNYFISYTLICITKYCRHKLPFSNGKYVLGCCDQNSTPFEEKTIQNL